MANDKVKLGNKPKTFEKLVGIVLLSGVIADILVTFKYRTRKEFAQLFTTPAADGGAAAAPNAVAEAPAAPKSVEDYFAEHDQSNADFVLKIAEGWDLDDKFGEEKLLQLEDENPGALAEIALVYRHAVGEARVKNS